MSEPIVFISHFRIKEGKLDGLKQHSQMMAEQIKADKPGTVVFLQYFNHMPRLNVGYIRFKP